MGDEPNDYSDAPEIDTNIECPACGSLLFLTFQTKDIPYEGEINIQTYYCRKCYYKHTEIYSAKGDQGMVITLDVSSREDLSTIIYRSPGGTVRIPEIEVEISPGEESHGEITTIEGILLTVRDKMEMFMEDSEDRNLAERTLKKINEALSGSDPCMTVEVEDPTGKSMIHSPKAVTRIM